jgi:hypothetical protein
VVQEDGAAGLQQVLVNETHDGDIELGATRGRDDGVVVVNDFLHSADSHWAPAKVVHARAVFLVLVLARVPLGAETLLVLHKLLLHEHVVLDPLCLQQLEPAARRRRHHRQLARLRWPTLLLTPNACRHRWLPLLLLLLRLVLVLILILAHAAASALGRDAGWCVALNDQT